MSRPSVDVTIVSSQARLLDDCLRSLFETTDTDLVDMTVRVLWNGTGRGFGPLPDDLRERYPTVIWRDEALNGYARSQDALLEDCTRQFIALANDDLVFMPGTITGSVGYLADPAHASVAMVGVRTLWPDGHLQRSTYPVPTPARSLIALTGLGKRFVEAGWWRWLSRLNSPGQGNNRSWGHDRTVEVQAFGGALMVVRAAVVRAVGPMDVVNLGGVEEIEWQTRMRRAGWKIMFLGDTEVVHIGGQTTGLDPNRDRESFLGYLNYFWKHGRTRDCVLFGLGTAGWFATAAVARRVMRRPGSAVLLGCAADGARFAWRAMRTAHRLSAYRP